METTPTHAVIMATTEVVAQNLTNETVNWTLNFLTWPLVIAVRTPVIIYRILTYTFTLTLDFWSLLILFTLLCTITYYVIRYRLMTKYSRLPDVADRKPGTPFDLHPDITNEEEKDEASYQDDLMKAFLSSIKVFGYLDRPVFQELAKHLQTKKLKEGEILFGCSDPTRDFHVVVEGCVQVLVKTDDSRLEDEQDADWSLLDDTQEDLPGHLLLNEVKAGETVTSLFSILSVLTDNLEMPGTSKVPLNPQEKQESSPNEQIVDLPPVDTEMPMDDTEELHSLLGDESLHKSTVPDEANDETQKITPTDEAKDPPPRPLLKDQSTTVSPVLLEKSYDESSLISTSQSKTVPEFPFLKSSESHELQVPKIISFQNFHPNIVARCSTDCTIAIIPAEAFSKLAEKFPFAAAHMAHVILTRFQRVTYHTLYKYLGLSRELVKIERRVNELIGMGCPKYSWQANILSQPASNDSIPNTESNKPFDLDLPENKDLLRKETFEIIAESIGIHVQVPFSSVNTGSFSHRTSFHPPSQEPDERMFPSLYIRRQSTDKFIYHKRRRLSVDSVITNDDDPDAAVSVTRASSISSFNQSTSQSLAPFHVYQNAANELVISNVESGTIIVQEGEKPNGLYFVINGTLEASTTAKNRKKNLFSIGPGDFAFYMTAFTGHVSYVTLEAKTDAQLAFLPKKTIEKLSEKFPSIELCLGKKLLGNLMPTILHMDMSLEWEQINSGHVLCRQGDPCDSVYIVLNGRLRCIVESNREPMADDASVHDDSEPEDIDNAFGSFRTRKKRSFMKQETEFKVLGEYGRDDSIGQLEILTQAPRAGTVYAIRDTEVTILPRKFLEALGYLNPSMSLEMMKRIASMTSTNSEKDLYTESLEASNVNLKNVAIIPVHLGVPIVEFSERLKNALGLLESTAAVLNTASVMSALGKHAFSSIGKLKLMNWLSEQEDVHRLVLYVADGGVNSSWTQRCIRQADCILLVGLGDEEAGIGEFERLIIGMKSTARKELVLLHPDRSVTPGSTATWLKNRMWIHAHHHVQMPLSVPELITGRKATLLNLKMHFQSYYTRIGSSVMNSGGGANIHTGLRSDFARLGRRLLFKSVALVLGGGGARGIAHVGMLRAFEEHGIPIDLVGGNSIGAFVGGLYARENDQVKVYGRSKMFCSRAASIWRKLLDITFPFTAMFTGHEFNRGIWKAFLDSHIEDCWLNFFCVSTNITWSRLEIHRYGYIWKYVRASMTLAGYLPPICDKGNLLVDGGYLNNLPADVMKGFGAETVIAIDVGLADDTSAVNYGDSLSGWYLLLQKMNPLSGWLLGADVSKIPQMADIQSRLAYVSSVKPLREVQTMQGVIYLQPPVSKFGTLEFGSFNSIYKAGYEYGVKVVEQWRLDGTFERVFGIKDADQTHRDQMGGGGRRQSI